jgi:hypothetical protein
MRNLFALIGILVIGLGGAGWYLGWYKVHVTKNPDGEIQIQTDVDTKKVSGDSSAFFQKVEQVVNKNVETNASGTPTPAAAPANTPGTGIPGTAASNNAVPGSTQPNNTPPALPLPIPTPPGGMP